MQCRTTASDLADLQQSTERQYHRPPRRGNHAQCPTTLRPHSMHLRLPSCGLCRDYHALCILRHLPEEPKHRCDRAPRLRTATHCRTAHHISGTQRRPWRPPRRTRVSLSACVHGMRAACARTAAPVGLHGQNGSPTAHGGADEGTRCARKTEGGADLGGPCGRTARLVGVCASADAVARLGNCDDDAGSIEDGKDLYPDGAVERPDVHMGVQRARYRSGVCHDGSRTLDANGPLHRLADDVVA